MKKTLLLISVLLLTGCLGMPESVKPVSGFELKNYLGKWYEIARLDHSFERGLSQVSAEYRLKSDGGVVVINRGFSEADNEWKEAEGKAYFVNEDSEGYLKVSFFGPFYGSYVIFELAQESLDRESLAREGLDRDSYQYAFISGPNSDYLWFLARTASVEPAVIQKFVDMSKARGFKTENLIYVQQE